LENDLLLYNVVKHATVTNLILPNFLTFFFDRLDLDLRYTFPRMH